MPSPRNQRRVYTAVIGVTVLGVLGFLGVRYYRSGERPSRIYRIGYGNDVPFQFKTAEGMPTGIAVEIVREAARRREIQLQWTEPVHAGIGAILSGETDLWVLLTDLPDRRKQIYITEPYLTTERSFLVLKGGKIRSLQDLTRSRLAFRASWSKTAPPPGSEADFANADELYLKQSFPNATLVSIPYDNIGDLVAALKDNRADAGLLNKNVVAALLLAGGDQGNLDLVSAPNAISQLGLAATFDAQDAAREIREEMRAMAEDGTITRLTQRWGFFETASLDIIGNLSAARRASRVLEAGVAGLGAAVLFIGFLAIRLRRERNTVRDTQVALRESEGYYRSLVELLPDTIYRADAEGRILPRTAASVPSAGMPDLRFLEASASHRQSAAAACRRGQPAQGEEKTPDGRVLEFRLIPVHAASGRADQVIGILRDVTSARAAEAERRRLLDERQGASRLESLGRLAGGVAHDFNNLLTVINGYSSQLLKNLSGQPHLQRPVSEIQAASLSAASLTEQLLAFSQKRMLKPEVLDLNSVVLGSARMLEKLIGDQIALELDLASGLDPVMATVGSLQQVLINLAANAHDAMPRGGRLRIRTYDAEGAASHSDGSRPATGGVWLTVEDTGQGIPAGLLDRIFEPFFTTKEVGRGTGLGLATVYGIVKQQGGSITVESQVGRGTTFRIYFPAALAAPSTPEQPGESPETALLAATVLLAEDDPSVRTLTAGILRSEGCTVLEAADGVEALQICRDFEGRIDLLVSDLMMPRMRGTELAAHLRVSHPHIPVLLLTGYATEAVDGLARGQTPFLLKPFSPEQLVAAAAKALVTRIG